MKSKSKRTVTGILATIGLLLLFVFQQLNYAQFVFEGSSPLQQFLVNRTIRFFLNDACSILLIYALFYERKYVVFAVYVQVIGFLFLLLPYFCLKIYWPAYNGPLINYLHRIIINPTLMILLIPAFYFQRINQVK